MAKPRKISVEIRTAMEEKFLRAAVLEKQIVQSPYDDPLKAELGLLNEEIASMRGEWEHSHGACPSTCPYCASVEVTVNAKASP